MERLNFRIKRTNPDIYSSLPCSGGTNYWPINYSVDCSGMSMYNATASQLMNVLDGDITTFPEELRQCSLTNPCVILWDLNYSVNSGHCTNIGNYAYKAFYGFNVHDSVPTQIVTGETYDYIITLFESLYVDFSKPINTTSEYNISYIMGPCHCDSGLADNLNNLTLFLSQDFNDIGHYSVWDGNISQKEAFSNFVFTASTTAVVGDTIQIWNTTDFSYYKGLQDLPWDIDWGDGGAGGGPTQLTYSVGGGITASNTYVGGVPTQYRITITQDTPWGPTSVSQIITAPNYNYNQLMAFDAWSNTGLTINPSGVTVGSGYTSGPSGTFGQTDYIAWDGGTHIDEYSGLTQFPDCFEVTGVTTSILGIFQTYTAANSPFLPQGYTLFTTVPIGGDVINPITNNIEAGMYGSIYHADAIYTGYTVSSANNATPINFYDFPNGITLYVAESCGLDALAFGAYDCFKCTVQDCIYCETKDEYVDRITGIATPITFNTQQGVWNPHTDYMEGDIVFDTTYETCCCFMAVKDIVQVGPSPSLWASVPPSQTLQGVWYQYSVPIEHIWEACSPECENCPPGTSLPCHDTTITHYNSPAAPSPNVGQAGPYQFGLPYPIGSFAVGAQGNCYQALSADSGNYPPTAYTSTTYWEYVSCSSWICPQDLLNIPPLYCELVPGTGITTSTNVIQGHQYYGGCLDDFDDGECYADRWICLGQYGCEDCEKIDSTHLQYTDFDPLNPLAGPVFSSQMPCEGWCNPPVYSCTTIQAGDPNACCTLFSCQEDDANLTPGLYTALVTNTLLLVPGVLPNGLTANEWLAINEQFYFTGPPNNFDLADCNSGTNGVTPTSYLWESDACCNYDGFDYECCTGCVPVTFGGTYQTLPECQTAVGNNGGAIQPCGWSCVTINQPCVPCYDCNCGYAGFGFTPAGYSACTADCSYYPACYVCDCTLQTPCDYENPCLGPIDGITRFTGTTQGNIDCNDFCTCDAGWDCYLDISGTSPVPTYCRDGVSGYFMAMNSLAFSDPTPGFTGYSDFTACCIATECCFADCDDTLALGTEPGNQAYFPGGYWPCYFVPQYAPAQPGINCDPTGPPNWGWPYCTMLECTTALAANPAPAPAPPYLCDVAIVDDCFCACDDYMTSIGQGGTVLTPQGQYVIGPYTLHDIVFHQDADSPLCCYVCMCPSLMGAADCITTFDCSCFIPDDGAASNGTPNCWEPCGATPGLSPSGCQPCGAIPSNTWECTTSGCSQSACIHNPSITQESQNCYTANTCEGHCRASCYCEDAVNDITNCVVLQDWMNNTNTGVFFAGYPTFPPVPQGATHPIYPMASLDDCLAMLGIMDCCPGGQSADTWYCDYTSNCETTAGNAGVGCVVVMGGMPGYPGPFTSLSACQEYCTWECGCPPNGLGTCIFNALSTAAFTAGSAYDCWLAFSDCDCCAPPNEFWCDTYGALNGDYTAGVPASACRPSTYYAGASSSHQQGAIGQLAGGPLDPTNTYFDAQVTNNFTGVGFPDQLSCENWCRFCCDCAPPGSSNCNDVDWGVATCTCTAIPSELTPYFCEQQTAGSALGYPCTAATTEFYCIDITGCQSFLSSSPPVTFISGPHIDLPTCQAECTWACGDCIGDCFCTFQASQICTPFYYDLTLCQTAVAGSPPRAGGNSCCDCYECFAAGTISYVYFDDPLNAWMIGSVTVTPFTQSAPAWNSGTNYAVGDVVTFEFDGDTCCYVCVDGDATNFWTIDPYTYYTYYINDVNTLNPVWPGPAGAGTNATNSGTLVWITCDTNCATVPIITYDCFPGIQAPPPGTCAGKTLIPGGNIGTYPALQWICDPANTIPPATLFSDFYHEGNNAVTSANDACPAPNGDAMEIPTYVNFYSCPNDAAFQTAYMPINCSSKQDWVTQLVNAGLAATTSMDFFQLRALVTAVCGSQMGQAAGGNFCICANSPCHCDPVSGPGGQYLDSASCQQTFSSVPCCGFWECIPGTMCSCVFNNTLTTYLGPPFNYYTQQDCENDSTTCCSGVTSMNYLCQDWDCQCVPDISGPYANLTECLTDPLKCCYTGSSISFNCIQGNNQICHCVQVNNSSGTYPLLSDCLGDPNDCCYSGMGGNNRWDCIQTLGSCNCVMQNPGVWGPYADLHECLVSHTCCNSGHTGTTGYLCRQTIVSHGGPGGVITYSTQCLCEPTTINPVYATIGDCLNDPTDCCWTGTSVGMCTDCQGQQWGYGEQLLDGIFNVFNFSMQIMPPTFDNTATAVGYANPQIWTANALWGDAQIVLSPLDLCCYIHMGDSNGFAYAYQNFDPSACYNNWLLGLACDGSSSASPTQVHIHQAGFPIWIPCDHSCHQGALPTYDCNQSYQCVSPVGGGGFYTGPTAYNDCLLGCNPQGCDDCSSVLNSFMVPGAPVSFLGTWQPTVIYTDNECVVDPDDLCCYCCVVIDDTVWSPGDALTCKDFHQPSAYINVAMAGGGGWMSCGYTQSGDTCFANGDCDGCHTTLASSLGTTPITFGPWPGNSGYYNYNYGACISNPYDGCCWCCIDDAMGPISPPNSPDGSIGVMHDSQLGPQPMSTFNCHIDNGVLQPGSQGHWESCLVDQNGNWCAPQIVYGCTDCGLIYENDPILNPSGMKCWEHVLGNVVNPFNFPNPTVSLGALAFYPGASVDDGSCVYGPMPTCPLCTVSWQVPGCCDDTALNYDPLATCNDLSCIAILYGCTDPLALNYYAGANIDDGSCIY